MTLEEKCKLVNDLIEENPDLTIKDFIEICQELAKIEEAA